MQVVFLFSLSLLASCGPAPCAGVTSTAEGWLVHSCELDPEAGAAQVQRPAATGPRSGRWWDVSSDSRRQVDCKISPATECPRPGLAGPWGGAEDVARGSVRATLGWTDVGGGSHRSGFTACGRLAAPQADAIVVYCLAEWDSDGFMDVSTGAKRDIRRFVRGIEPVGDG